MDDADVDEGVDDYDDEDYDEDGYEDDDDCDVERSLVSFIWPR